MIVAVVGVQAGGFQAGGVGDQFVEVHGVVAGGHAGAVHAAVHVEK